MKPTIRSATLFLLIVFGFGINLYAQNTEECQLGAKTVVFFGNGMETPERKADDDKKQLQEAIGKDVQDGKLILPPGVQLDSVCYDIAYNTDLPGRYFLDFLDAFVQQSTSFATSGLWRILFGLEKLPGYLQVVLNNTEIVVDKFSYLVDTDLKIQVDRYLDEINNQHRKVIVVSHSQGNFYSNQAYRNIFGFETTDKFEIVSVANPDSFVAGDKPWFTLYGDIILVVPGRLDANTDPDKTPCRTDTVLVVNDSSVQCHDFTDSYLVGKYSRANILGQIINAIPITPPPPPNIPPVSGFTMASVGFTIPQSAHEGEVLTVTPSFGTTVTINFNADRSTDVDGSIEGWEWTLDGSVVNTSTFTQPLDIGSHAVSLIVTDNLGAMSELAGGSIVVLSPPPPPPPTGIRQITNTSPGNSPGQPVGISRDGSHIVFLIGNVNSPQGGQLWSVNIDGSNLIGEFSLAAIGRILN
ncbi:MAG: hypothetical protein Q8R55_06665 [Candidatus Taylorbacteria bacterium]|nr:hypothetical protein [Candidatus Taylorbacteria bacterium]